MNSFLMTPLDKIDFVFFYLKDKIEIGGSWGYYNIWNHVEKTPTTGIASQKLLREILTRLTEDGFITEITQPEAQSTYHLTFKGVLFQGYKKKALNTKIKNALYLASLVAVIIAGLYYLLEIYKDIIEISR